MHKTFMSLKFLHKIRLLQIHTNTSHTKNLKNEKGRDGEKVNKQDGMPM